MKTNKGITLIALTITIIVLIILASVTTYSGISTIKSSKLNKFKQELEIMQAEVNVLYERYKDDLDAIDIGKDISTGIDLIKQTQANDAFYVCGVSDTDKVGYRLFDFDTIKELNIEGIEREYLVNVAKRDVICIEGFEQGGQTYYRLKDLTEKNTVDYGISDEDITFDVNATELSENKCEIVISNIKFSKYVGKGTISYKKLEADSTWGTSTTVEKEAKANNNYSFTVNKAGKYQITIEDAAGKTTNKEITVEMSSYLPIPENAVISEIEGEYGNIDKGEVIYIMRDADGDGTIDTPDWSDPEKMRTTYDQFVWVPVPNAVLDLSNNSNALSTEANIKAAVQNEIKEGRYPMAIKKDATNYLGVLYQFSLSATNEVKVEPYSSWTPLNNTYYREPSAITSYDTSTYLPQVNGILNTGYSDSTSFANALQTEFNTMVNKVASNKGFWVGRYETSGMSNSTTETYASSNEIKVNVVKGTTTGISGVTWYRMYAQQKLYSSKANITLTSSMIWGSQWDQIMIWMKNEPNETSYAGTSPFYVINSQGMGNFGTSAGGAGSKANVGYYAVKNIYDLAGNVYDWTLEASSTSGRVLRGGSYINSDSSYTRAVIRDYYDYPNSSYTYNGSRSSLY